MPKFAVEFKHVEETTYTGWVEAETSKEAYTKVKNEPFDINDLQDGNIQGLDIIDIYVDEVEGESL